MRVLFTLLISVIGSLTLAQEVESLIEAGNQAYEAADYAMAIDKYDQADSLVQSADLDLNLGNAYYKSGALGKAILHYERAYKLSPMDEDIQHNLTLARNLTLDKLEESSSSGFTLWWRGVLLKIGMDQLAWWSIIAAVLSALGWVLFRLSASRARRQLGFALGSLFLIATVLTAWMSLSARSVITTQDEGIILTSRVEVLSAPDEGSTELFVLHEGSKVTLVEERGSWTSIALPNGNKGWLKSAEVEGI
jgi:hypothetical protein